MKVLFIGHYREGSGYSEASFGYINALMAAGYEVICKPYKLNSSNPEIPKHIAELEKSINGRVDAIIQHLLPHNMSYIPGAKNIGICVNDTSSLKYSEWDRFLNCMDEVWIPQEYSPIIKELTVPVKYVPHAFDTTRYKNPRPPIEIKELDATCVFYTIGELNIRKNFRDAIIAFHTEFHSNEPVNYLIKTSGGNGPQDCLNIVSQSINAIKADLKLYPSPDNYKPEIIITNRLPDEQIEQLHSSGYCYVNTSRGEGWSIPQFDAWAYGNKIISYISDTAEYPYLPISKQCNLVEVRSTNVFAYRDTFQNLGTAREDWGDTDIPSLRRAMRKVYNEWLENPSKTVNENYENYSYESVGKIIKDIL